MDLSARARRHGDSMKLLVLGATGGTGLEIVRQAIALRHQVTAFVRSAERLKPFGSQVVIKQGDLLKTAELKERSAVTMRSYRDLVPGSPSQKPTRPFSATSPLA